MSIIIIAILIVLVIVNAFEYFFSINVTAYIQGLFSPKTEVDIVVDQSSIQPAPVPTIRFKKQVFNIPGNYYNYNNARALCKAYGAELATYDQLEKAYNDGAEWCNYGWSANQLALFPTLADSAGHILFDTRSIYRPDIGKFPKMYKGNVVSQNKYADKMRFAELNVTEIKNGSFVLTSSCSRQVDWVKAREAAIKSPPNFFQFL
jgi:hypothetical protein